MYGTQKLLYADWIASGRLYFPIEEIMLRKIGPMIANTHSFSCTYSDARASVGLLSIVSADLQSVPATVTQKTNH
ncbi:hypothetical protein [Flavobacterium hungaricum]|uniref:hypothetical protein n=1 Tax=Flavobacterium hungaricum TaxID=2082725 RepID=UPI001D134D17|nr:hypothetical protein [Flavobacterium hungaricum]